MLRKSKANDLTHIKMIPSLVQVEFFYLNERGQGTIKLPRVAGGQSGSTKLDSNAAAAAAVVIFVVN